MGLVAGVDVGGTNIAVGLVDDDHEVVEEVEVTTPTDGPKAVVDAVADALDELDTRPEAIGIGAPGPVSDGVLLTAPNLQGFTEPVPLASLVADATGVPATLGNDANMGIVGEWAAGAARGYRSVLGIWLGTGVGGGLVLDGRPYDGVFGSAGEFGHMIFRQGGALCGCGRRGCVEAYAGRASMEHVVKVEIEAGRPTRLLEIMEEEGKDRLTSKVWKKALEEDDPLAVRVIDEAIAAVAVALGATLNLLDLDCVVIGGGLAEKLGQPLADRIADAAKPYTMTPDTDRHVVVAALGDHSGMIGAARSARELAKTVRNAALPS